MGTSRDPSPEEYEASQQAMARDRERRELSRRHDFRLMCAAIRDGRDDDAWEIFRFLAAVL